MVDARTELKQRTRAIQSGELPMPERHEGESDSDWLDRIAKGRAAVPAIGDRFVAPRWFQATSGNRTDPSPIHVLQGEVVVVREVKTIAGEQVLRCNIEGDESQFILIEPWRLARYAKQMPEGQP